MFLWLSVCEGVAPHTHTPDEDIVHKAFLCLCVSSSAHHVVFIGNNMSEGFNANIWLPSMAPAKNQYICVLL